MKGTERLPASVHHLQHAAASHVARVRQVLSSAGGTDSAPHHTPQPSVPLFLIFKPPSSSSHLHRRCVFILQIPLHRLPLILLSPLMQPALTGCSLLLLKLCNICKHNTSKLRVAVHHCISKFWRQMCHVKPGSVASHTHTDLLFFSGR